MIGSESGGNAQATSKVGAGGLMQIMPDTARGLGITDVYDPLQNVVGGSRYLASLLQRYKGNLRLALAAYNAGPGAVDKYHGVPPFAETRSYVDGVIARYTGAP